jgi:uncharacterized surface protein with fasciclin (FAS1) repeats
MATGWPNVISTARKTRSSWALFAGTAASQAKTRSRLVSSRLRSLSDRLGLLVQRTQQDAKALIAAARTELAKSASGLVGKAREGRTFGVLGEKVAARLSSLSFSGLGSKTGLMHAVKGQGFVAAGLATGVALLAVLIAGYTQLAPSAEASLTFPIPERPISAGTPRVDAISDEGADAINSILSYVAAQSSSPGRAAPAPTNPILAKVAAMDGFDEFTRVANTVDLGQLLEPGQPYTIFLPNDEAFAKLGRGELEGLLQPTGHERLLTLLSHHIVPERVTLDGLKHDSGPHISLAGHEVPLDGGDAVRVGGAGIVDTDLEADNSILHVIDGVLAVPQL